MGAANPHLRASETVLIANQIQATNGSEIDKLRAVARCGLRLCLTIFMVACLCGTALAASRTPQRRGKVIIIRGALTVFSLGMNELGEKLEQYGLDVEVVADISAGRAASKLRSEYQRNRNVGPIVFIGHSRGAELGPKQARYLQRYKIPVKLVVMVDAVHQTSVPGNVERCVNLYHNNALGFIHGVPARAESKRTQMVNTDINRLSSRDKGGSINHFNIDASPWIHELVVAEVLKACPRTAPSSAVASRSTSDNVRESAAVRKSTAARQSAPSVARRQSKSGLKYPAGIVGGLWSESAGNRASSSSTQDPPQRGTSSTQRSRSRTNRVSKTSRMSSAQRWGIADSSRSGKTSARRSTTRTAARPQTSKTPRANSPTSQRSTASNGRTSTTKPPPSKGSSQSLRSDPDSKATGTTKLKQPLSLEKRSSGTTERVPEKSESKQDTQKSTKKKAEPVQVQLKG